MKAVSYSHTVMVPKYCIAHELKRHLKYVYTHTLNIIFVPHLVCVAVCAYLGYFKSTSRQV